MNSAIIIEDIKKRSYRLQREQFLRQLKQDEEEAGEQYFPKRILEEAEENVSRKHADQGWKRYTVVGALFLGSAYIIYRLIILLTPNPKSKRFTLRASKPREDEIKPPTSENKEEEEERQGKPEPRPRGPKKMVMFSVDRKLDVLQELYPRRWVKFERNFQADWFVSSLREDRKPLVVDFFLENDSTEEDSIAIDMITSDMLDYPSETKDYFSSQSEYDSFIYEIKEKKDIFSSRGIVYRVLQMDKIQSI
jgi:hypothetical protein